MTARLYMDDPTLRETTATVLASGPDGIVLDRTVFYARAGGQPGDVGNLHGLNTTTITIADTIKHPDGSDRVLHIVAAETNLPAPGTSVVAALDWPRRAAIMRMHSALHLLCAAIPGAAVTGGQIGTDRARLDLDLPTAPDRDALTAALMSLVAADHPITTEWVDEEILDHQPAIVRTLSVKPPRGSGRVRLVRIGANHNAPVDLQPCGGTHVDRTGLIGGIEVVKIENKGRQNRRVVIAPVKLHLDNTL
jgi:misacylated tRNA(Ala) deacylase